MVIDSVDTLLAVLRRVHLLPLPQVDEIEQELAPHYQDPLELSDYLVELDWLTVYQRDLLFEGRWTELTIGPYQIMKLLGEGNVGEVFKAWDTVKGRVVALKVLRQHLAVKPEAVAELRREREAVIHLVHPNIVKTYDADHKDGVHYFAMEFVDGMDLHQYVQRCGPLPTDQACDFARQAAQGLQHAHQAGLVHRDIKPANLFLLNPPLPPPAGANGDAAPTAPPTESRRSAEPVVKILDWGLARLRPSDGDAQESSVFDTDAEKGLLIGTADYIAPEQAQDAALVDTRADIYSLGCVLYFLLTGRPPFAGPSLMQKILQHQEEPAAPIHTQRPDVPEELNAVVMRMMAKYPENRFQIPLLAAAALRRFCTGPAAGLAGMAGTVGGAAFRPSSSGSLLRPASNANLQKPGTAAALSRPTTAPALGRPGSSSALPDSDVNPNRYPPLGR